MMTIENLKDLTRERVNACSPTLPKISSVGALIIETREIEDIEYIVKNHILGMEFTPALTFYHSAINEEFIKEKLKSIRGIQYVKVTDGHLDNAKYNELITSSDFWMEVLCSKVLVFQSDSLIINTGFRNFLMYDYIGAPWKKEHIDIDGGNGGFSIRNTRACFDVTMDYKYNVHEYGNEDLYFCRKLKDDGYNVAKMDDAMRFSVETVPYKRPVGIHAADKYLSPEQLSEILSNCDLLNLHHWHSAR